MIGKRLGDRYEITGELGRGGMGVVYRARDPVLERDVAVKVAPASLDEGARSRLRREATVVAQMDHPSIVPVHDMGEDGDSLYFVMPVVSGANLRSHLADGSLRALDVLEIGHQVAEGLDYSHQRGVLHRDVKPENIMVERDADGRVRARIMDFGLAWTGFETRLTKTGSLIGTIAYLSPEQVSDQDIDERTDIYSLAVVLYECFAGAPPFTGETHSMLYRIVYEKPLTLRSVGVEVSDAIDSFLSACLSKAPRDRPAKASDVAARLAELRKAIDDAGTVLLPPVRETPFRGPVEVPFVGRETELAALRTRLDAAVAGECQLVVVRGDAGTGKTRLVDELDRIAGARDVRVLRGRFSGQERDLPFNGFCEVIQDFFRLKEVSPSSTGLPDLSDLAGELLASFPMLGEITFLRDAAATGVSPVEGKRDGSRTELFELIARALARLGGGRPLVVVVEDLHQASVSAEAIPYIVRRLAPTPTMILATYCRTEADARHPTVRMVEAMTNSPEFMMLDLLPLTASQVATLLGRIAGEEIDLALAKRIHASTDGNPLFAQELFRSLDESDELVSSEGGIRLRRDVSVLTGELPATLRQAVERRIEGLSVELSRLLAMASVIGRSFDYRELAHLAEHEHPSLDDEIDRLIEEGLLREEREARGDRLAFVSGIVREAVYATLTRRRKRSLHRRLGEYLEDRPESAREQIAGRLMFHFARADDAARTIRYGLMSARLALDAFSVDEALEHIHVVLEFIDDEGLEDSLGTEGEAHRLAALAHRQHRDVHAALRSVGRSVAAHARDGFDDRALASMVLGARTAWEHRLVEQASEWSERAVEVAKRTGEPADRHEAFILASTIANLRGHHQDAAALRDRAVQVDVPAVLDDEEDRAGGRLVVGLTTELDEFDPASSLTAEEDEVLANVFETLLQTDVHGELAPRLCERWEVVESGRAVLLHLRKGVLFHDGTPFNAAIAKRSLETALQHSFGRARMALAAVFNVDGRRRAESGRIPDLAGLVVQDEHVLRIRLGRPFPAFPRLLTSPAMAMAHRRDGDLASGTGRFSAIEVTRERVVVRARDDHWSGTRPRVDEIEFRLGLDPEALLSSLDSGTIDLGRQLPVEGIEHVVNDPGTPLRIVDSPKKNVYFVLFGSNGARAVPENVRRAMIRGVRYDDLVRESLGRFAESASGMIPPGILGHDPGLRRSTIPVTVARESVSRSRDGAAPIELDAAIHPVFVGRYSRLLERLIEAWADLGIRLRNVTPSMTSFLRAAQSGEFVHMLIGRWTADYDDPDNFTHGLFHSLDGSFRGFYSSAELDRLGEGARRETDPAERHRFYRRYIDVLTRAEVVAPMFHDNDLGLLGRRVRRVRMTGSAPYVDYGSLEVRSPGRGPTVASPTGARPVHVPCGGSITSTDPARAWTSTAFEILPNVYETLTRVSQVGGVRPWLAASFESGAEGSVHRFRLRDDVRFHDGRRLTVRDVRYTFERVLRNPANRINVLSCIRGAKELTAAEANSLEGFEVLSTTDFALHLVEPVRHLPLALSSPTLAIVPDGAVPLSKGGEGLFGTGPFRIDHFEPGRVIELSAHTDYWRDGLPRSRRLVFEMGVGSEEIMEAFRSAHFAIAADISSTELDELRRDSSFAGGQREAPGLATAFLVLNSARGPLAKIEARRRVLAVLDAEGIVTGALDRPWSPASGLFPPELKGVDSARRTTRIPRPVEGDGVPLKLTIAVPFVRDESWQEMAAAIIARLDEIDVDVEVANEDLAGYFRCADEGSVDMVLGRWQATYPDCDSFAHGLLDSGAGALRALVRSNEIDRLIATGRRESDPIRRNEAYQRIEDLLSRRSLLMPLFHPQVCRVARPELRGLRLSLGRPAVAYEELAYRES